MFVCVLVYVCVSHNIFSLVGIEAADLTSLLEQFEETQGNRYWQICAEFCLDKGALSIPCLIMLHSVFLVSGIRVGVLADGLVGHIV